MTFRMFGLMVAVCSCLSATTPKAAAEVSSKNSFVSCKPFASQADGTQTCNVTVAVRHADGTIAPGKTVTLTSNRADADTITPAAVTTDDDGVARFEVRSTEPGNSTLAATCDGVRIDRGIILDGAVGIYTFDGIQADNVVRDLSLHANHGEIFGSPEFVDGHFGRAISLDGESQYIEIPDSPSMNGSDANYIEAWVRVAADVDDRELQIVAQKSYSNRGDYALSIDQGRIAYHYRSAQRAKDQREDALSLGKVFHPDRWMHTAGFWEGSDIAERVRHHGYVRGYVSENEFDPQPKSQQVEGIWKGRTSGEPFSIGRSGDDSAYFHGVIDELRVYDRALYDEEMRRNHSGDTTITFGLECPNEFSADDKKLPECVVLSWELCGPHVTTYEIYRSEQPDVAVCPENLLIVVPHGRDHFRDYNVEFDKSYHYRLLAKSFTNASEPSEVVSATPYRAEDEPRWYLGDGHFHTYTHDIFAEDFTPEMTLAEAKKLDFDFVLVTEHNSLGSYFRAEDQATKDFIVFGNGQEISDGGKHRTGAFLKHFVPTTDQTIQEQNAMALSMGAEVGPNHSDYFDGPNNITLFELVNNRDWYSFEAWDNQYLKKGIPVIAKGGSDAHGRWSVKRGIRWCVWAERHSYMAIKEAIHQGRTLAVDGKGLLCMLRVNDSMIGDRLTVSPGTSPEIQINATAEEGTITAVRLVRHGEIIQSWEPNAKQFDINWTDNNFSGGPTYYRLEVESKDPNLQAVSSAIFVDEPS
ncbi:CehA/McbA family metallohydrolase [Rhodopirellula sallentina]|uniref:CehA/McbA family metallohydrolase n=1 Tax=Rhodopirellula sallentina TaxID=1263869 RepID=UPI001181A95B|nr:CehA/McbA family metallohydrolase [Rhodopirellula sallentina]